ncbi:MAG: N-formylglutamate amidohydrolase [bacterium]|nr:N-formylglutamate amidohydrolase [bacterium]
MREPLLISIPHGGWRVAEEVQHIWNLSDRDAFHDGDPCTSLIYDFSDRVSCQLVMEYYRAVVDLNRAPDDIAPANKDGVVKSHTCYDVEVYKPGCLPDEGLKQLLLDKYYHPYHRRMAESLKRADVKMGVDCHSMAAVSPPIEADAGTPRPLICVGNLGGADGEVAPPFNRITCSAELIRFMADEFANVLQHEDVEIEVPALATANVPFSGGRITQDMGGAGIPFVQIEMSRALYLSKAHFDESTLEVDGARIRDLNAKVWRVLEKAVRNL